MGYVKNTMPDRVANLIIPHYCCACGEIGGILCESCKNDILNESFAYCLLCLQPINNARGLCAQHSRSALGVSVVGWRRDGLESLVDISKFESVRPGCTAQADLLASILPFLGDNVAVVPIPTIAPHIRQRGFGHTEIIAKNIAQHFRYRYFPLLQRRNNLVQHGAHRAERERQARDAFSLNGLIATEATYLLIDDVYTTGATMRAAIKLLKSAGAKRIWLAVTSRQPQASI